MKMIVDIPKGAYEEICKAEFPISERYRLVNWIKEGTLLPKGHGRLIDADAIKPIYAPIVPLTPEDFVHYEWVYMKSEIDRASTIIEADKE